MIFKSSRALNQNVSDGQTKFIDYRLLTFSQKITLQRLCLDTKLENLKILYLNNQITPRKIPLELALTILFFIQNVTFLFED